MILRDGEGHELFEGHAVLGIDVEQRGRDRGQAQALFHDLDVDEEGRRDFLLGHALLAHGLEGAELVERMQRRALDIFGERHLVDQDAGAGLRHDTGHRGGLVEALLLHQQFQRPVAAAAGGHLERAGLLALGIDHRPDMQRLDQAAPDDGLGQFFDRDAGLHAPDVRLGEHELVEGDVARGRQGDLLNGSSHVLHSMTDAGEPLSPATSPSRTPHPSFHSPGPAPAQFP